MKGWEVTEVVFWFIVALVVGVILFLFSNSLLMGYLNVSVKDAIEEQTEDDMTRCMLLAKSNNDITYDSKALCRSSTDCKWCEKCSGYMVNNWKEGICIDRNVDCGYSCVNDWCGAPLNCGSSGTWNIQECRCV